MFSNENWGGEAKGVREKKKLVDVRIFVTRENGSIQG